MATKTPEVRMTPATLAVLMTDATDAPHGLGLGRTWTASDGAKRVRSIARDTIDRFVNRTGRTMHAYTVDEARAIVAESARAIGGGTGSNADAVRALFSARTVNKVKRAKSAPKPKSATETADKGTDAS